MLQYSEKNGPKAYIHSLVHIYKQGHIDRCDFITISGIMMRFFLDVVYLKTLKYCENVLICFFSIRIGLVLQYAWESMIY